MNLSIIIPSRNEEFLAKTVEDILSNIEGETEVTVILDGQWANPSLPQHPKLNVIYLPESIGQRASINLGVKLSKAKYIMKVDGHCAFDKGFDVKMMEDMQDDWTMVPVMRNLHAFNWVCKNKHIRYQGKSGPCKECGEETIKDVVWIAKPSPQSTSYRFDRNLKFQYFGEYKKKQEGDLVETMSLQGSCFMLTRDKYLELNICDEDFGSWGQQGTEVAVKTWLSGGKVICNKKTWYAHMFRTQGGDFGFPYPISQNQVNKAREYSKKLFLNDKLEKLINKFSPPDFTKGIVYYTDNKLNVKIAKKCKDRLLEIGLPITSVSLKPLDFGDNITLDLERGYLTMFKQILAGLEVSKADIIFLCEHDVLYDKSHFDFIPLENKFYYNVNVWKIDSETGKAIKVNDCRQTSGLCARRELLIEHYKKRIELVKKNGFSRNMGFEPGTHNRKERVDNYKSDIWKSKEPNFDIRHDNNLTPSRWKKEQFRNQRYVEGWKEKNMEQLIFN